MKPAIVVAIAAVVISVRLWLRRHRGGGGRRVAFRWPAPPVKFGNVGLVAAREIRERTRSRIFRIGTGILVLAVGAAIVAPTLAHRKTPTERVGVVGTLSAPLTASIRAIGPVIGAQVDLVAEPDLTAAQESLRSGRVDVVAFEQQRLYVRTPPAATSTSGQLVRDLARVLALQGGLERAGLTPLKAAELANPRPLPVNAIGGTRQSVTRPTSIYGLILLFVMLTQYGTWVLMGVVEEKSSRVVEVLLSAVRPRQLLGGKVAGIGVVALIQATIVVGVALICAAATGSSLLKGSAASQVVAFLVWVVLGYVFYSWVYAAAGSLASRQEHVQTLAFPLQLPVLLGYIASLTAATSGTASSFVVVLAYLPPTAPFAMPTLVGVGQANLWQFLLSVAISLAATVGVARVASGVYRRAILQVGRRVRLREVLPSAG